MANALFTKYIEHLSIQIIDIKHSKHSLFQQRKCFRNWDGIPNNVDAALHYSDGKSYFFKNGQYYKFDDDTISVEDGSPKYPRDTGTWWFGCSDTKSPLLYPKSER